MTKYKYQHTVQKAYLEGFAARNLPAEWKSTKATWVLSLRTGEIRLRSIDKVSARPYYYSFVDKYSKMNPLIEKWFQPVENDFVKLRAELRNLVTNINLGGRGYNLDPRYRTVLAEYLLVHMTRVPKMFEQMMEYSRQYHRSLAAKGHGKYDENEVKITALRILIRVGRTAEADVLSALWKRNFAIEFFPRTRVNLVTSDSPVAMHDPTRAPGLAYESTEVFFPLDSSIFLRLRGIGDEVRLVKHRDLSYADDINFLMGINANNEVYCSDPISLKKVADRMGVTTIVREPGRSKENP